MDVVVVATVVAGASVCSRSLQKRTIPQSITITNLNIGSSCLPLLLLLDEVSSTTVGCADAYYNLGCAYENGMGVEIDKKKAKHYYELAAMNGNVIARHNLGCMEYNAGNHQRAFKHFIISAKTGDKGSLDNVKQGYTIGHVTKDEYANTLRQYQKSQDEMKSEARDKALVARN